MAPWGSPTRQEDVIETQDGKGLSFWPCRGPPHGALGSGTVPVWTLPDGCPRSADAFKSWVVRKKRMPEPTCVSWCRVTTLTVQRGSSDRLTVSNENDHWNMRNARASRDLKINWMFHWTKNVMFSSDICLFLIIIYNVLINIQILTWAINWLLVDR